MAQGEQQHHCIDYIEFSVKDMNESKRFYSSVVGWEFNEYGPDYAGIKKSGGGEVGGLCVSSNIVSGGPLIVLYSQTLDKTLAAVKELGGKISKDIFAFPGGRRFQFVDPSGNELAVWSDK